MSLLIVYHSVTGTTRKLAEAALQGALEVCPAELHCINGDDIHSGRFVNNSLLEAIDRASGVLFGTPTFMGGPTAQFKAFADATGDRWAEARWSGKVAGGFTIGTNPNGDQLGTLVQLCIFAAQHGMIWCGLDLPGGQDAHGRNRLGAHLGLVADSSDGSVLDVDCATAKYLGSRTARIAHYLQVGANNSTKPAPLRGAT
jgi:NAD(P)H dehydrogenase (quinone)